MANTPATRRAVLLFTDSQDEADFMARSWSGSHAIFAGNLFFVHSVLLVLCHTGYEAPDIFPAVVCGGMSGTMGLAVLFAACVFKPLRFQRTECLKLFQRRCLMDGIMATPLVATHVASLCTCLSNGSQPSLAQQRYARTATILSMMVSMAAGLILPLRFISFTVTNAWIFITYVCVRCYLTFVDLQMLLDLSFVMGLLGMFCWSKYQQEKLERDTFLCARAFGTKPAGHRNVVIGAQQVVQNDTPEGAEGCTYEASSTSERGQAFEQVNAGDAITLPEQLKQISMIGKREHWLLDNKQLTVDPSQVLGAGTFGFVVRGMLNHTPVAVKVPRLSNSSSNILYLRELSNELRILRLIHHPNIVMLQGACIDVQACEMALVLEMVQGERLDHYIKNDHIEPSHLSRYSILLGVARALSHLHAQTPRIVHSDVKDSNIIVVSTNGFPAPKLLDFGLSRLLTKHAKHIGGSLEYMAPEVATRTHPPGCAADVFSFGRLAYFVVTSLRPCEGMDTKELKDMIRRQLLPVFIWPERHWMSSACKHMVEECVMWEPSLRTTMSNVYRILCTWPNMLNAEEGHRYQKLHVGDRGMAANKAWGESVRQIRGELGAAESRKRPLRQRPELIKAEGQSGNMRFTGFPPTKKSTMHLCLLESALGWNYFIAGSCCCAYHYLWQTLVPLVSEQLASKGCHSLRRPGSKCVQCHTCGLVEEDADSDYLEDHEACDMCRPFSLSGNA